ncbi:hypothetical protein VOM14_27235 [Paraburkholderia sp. MPAMCS5]|uniref:hypothetical protein n=1 Tax=Paraburkholderia sp. MPAMCS5 TaxID=3112563 RepID=UPI002E181686|nr:hypothetical protein [Paraburkholderia sp. MPAMCS5]
MRETSIAAAIPAISTNIGASRLGGLFPMKTDASDESGTVNELITTLALVTSTPSFSKYFFLPPRGLSYLGARDSATNKKKPGAGAGSDYFRFLNLPLLSRAGVRLCLWWCFFVVMDSSLLRDADLRGGFRDTARIRRGNQQTPMHQVHHDQ